jgi:HEAT repeat protein
VTSLDFLIIVAGVQAGFLVALVTLIVLTRWFWIRRRARLAGPQARLERTVQSWVRGATPVTRVLMYLRLLPSGLAFDMLMHYAARLPPEAARRLTTAASGQRWVAAIRADARSRHWWLRLEAGRLLSVAGRPQDVHLVLRLLADPHPAVVIAAIGVLERVPSAALMAAVLERLPGLAPTIQAYAAAALQRSLVDLGPVLLKYLTGQRDRPGLAAYVDLAARLGAPQFLTALTALADHPDVEVRIAVARGLGRDPDATDTDALQQLADDQAWQVRAQAIQALGRVRAQAVDVFQRGLRDSAWWVRLRAAFALMGAGPPGRDALLAAEIGADAFARDMAQLVLGLPPAALAEYRQ